ncbi:MAG: Fpg/Nei family DNA glycosylase [Flexistipes sinusarabici]|uniref:Fpg/Nei family DNA glycosylase n=1 Tax=Flexistipes sinusarabici TaxID=2352 RepID=A0A5D0MT13_FLESI|nr:DNA-formamidopyrimidine glycosylase family protein [Flexistipes sinusarabici]TYB34709.1 MAG: Fpg/Nei family DNA glycosylase [Flexistipes sinusarabici]
MPELPDVTYFKHYIDRVALHKKISAVQCEDERVLKNTNCEGLNRILKGEKFTGTKRRGKFLIINLANSGKMLILHFGMTGNISCRESEAKTEDEKKYSQLIIEFHDGSRFFWINKRLLGSVHLVDKVDEVATIKEMGPDALELSECLFLKLLSEHERKNIKAFLMDQSNIAGLGNEYSNELLFQADINPHRKIRDLSKSERRKIYKVMRDMFEEAIEIGVPVNPFPGGWLLAHLDDMTCPKDVKHNLKKETIAGRSAIYCPIHQA